MENLDTLFKKLKQGDISVRNTIIESQMGLVYSVAKKYYKIIDKDYDLQGDPLFVPRGCVLDFRGGSFSNGYICSDFASISAPLQQIFSVNVRLLGNWQNERLPVEWYGALGDDKTDCSVAINAAINNTTFRVVSLLAGHKYLITQSIKMRSSDFAFGCFDVAYSHESSPAAYI